MLSITSHSAYVLIDTSVTHSCMLEEYRSACSLTTDVVSELVMCVSTP